MKIAEIVASFPPHHGGTGYVCMQNAIALADRGHDVTVFAINYDPALQMSDPENIKVVRMNPKLKISDGALVPQLTSKLKSFDVYHLHYPFYGGAEFVWLASKVYQKKYLLTYHMDVHADSFLKKIILAAYETILQKSIIGKAATVTAPSTSFLKTTKVADILDWERVADVPGGGVDTKVFHPREPKRELIEKHNLENKNVILFVGNLQPFKGLHILIEAFAEIRDDNTVLLIVGGGYAEEQLQRKTQQLNLSKHVVFAGSQTQNGLLPDYYALGDFLVLPSIYSESYGLVILEAMATGLPVIVSDLEGPSQLVTPGVDGLVVKRGDTLNLASALLSLIENPSRRKTMGQNALKKAKKLTWQEAGRKLESALYAIADV